MIWAYSIFRREQVYHSGSVSMQGHMGPGRAAVTVTVMDALVAVKRCGGDRLKLWRPLMFDYTPVLCYCQVVSAGRQSCVQGTGIFTKSTPGGLWSKESLVYLCSSGCPAGSFVDDFDEVPESTIPGLPEESWEK